MNDQYKYLEQRLTPSMAQELIKIVDNAHKERGGHLAIDGKRHPVVDALARMKRLKLIENPKLGYWSIPSGKSLSQKNNPKIKTLDEFMNWARKHESGKYVFRDVPNAKYDIEASAFRRPDENKRDFEKFLQLNESTH